MVKIEFFHDVICSFCFPMSASMRKLAELRDDVEIVHRSFTLAWEGEDFIRMFGSRQAVKNAVLSHWQKANEVDEEHRFNIEEMKRTDFLFPLSKKPLIAAKAAGILKGEQGYWAAFDTLQEKFFVQSKNIEEDAVIEEAMVEAGMDLDHWRKVFRAKETEKAVLEDIELAHRYNIPSVPCLIIDGKHMVYGAKSAERLNQKIEEIKNGANRTLPLR